MSTDQYLRNILVREKVDTTNSSPVLGVLRVIAPLMHQWAGQYLAGIAPSGSFAKATANKSGTDIDFFISISSSVSNTLKEIYNSLFTFLQNKGYILSKQNVSINILVNGYSVDLVPAKRQDAQSVDHSLYRRKADTWTKTNVNKHINTVVKSGRREEIRIIKLWRQQKALDFPSFYLELTVLDALSGKRIGDLANNVWSVFEYLQDNFARARVIDPANTNRSIYRGL
jgi:tRNA nucleotidyltransferase (CCA-adding enzyme)